MPDDATGQDVPAADRADLAPPALLRVEAPVPVGAQVAGQAVGCLVLLAVAAPAMLLATEARTGGIVAEAVQVLKEVAEGVAAALPFLGAHGQAELAVGLTVATVASVGWVAFASWVARYGTFEIGADHVLVRRAVGEHEAVPASDITVVRSAPGGVRMWWRRRPGGLARRGPVIPAPDEASLARVVAALDAARDPQRQERRGGARLDPSTLAVGLPITAAYLAGGAAAVGGLGLGAMGLVVGAALALLGVPAIVRRSGARAGRAFVGERVLILDGVAWDPTRIGIAVEGEWLAVSGNRLRRLARVGPGVARLRDLLRTQGVDVAEQLPPWAASLASGRDTARLVIAWLVATLALLGFGLAGLLS